MTSTKDSHLHLERIEKLERQLRMLDDRIAALERQPATSSRTKFEPDLSAEDGALYNDLLAWRQQKATELGKPVYVVFTAEAAAAVATTRPTNAYELTKVHGFGSSRVDAYGDDILAIVKQHAVPSW